MEKYSTNELRNGVKVLLDGEPCTILSNEFIKPGKGQAFNRVKLRNLKTGRVLEKTFKSGESLNAADVLDVPMQYLYSDGEYGYFMHPESFEQISIKNTVISDTQQWLKPQEIYTVTLYNNDPITIEAQNFVILKIVTTDPGLKGDTAQGGSKSATLETGAVVRVPLFVETDEYIKIDTRTGEYVSRVKTA